MYFFFPPVSDMQNEKHCSPENLSRNNKWQLYCAWQSPGQLSVHRTASSDLYSMNLSVDISLSLLGLQLALCLQGRCPQIHNVCLTITEMRVWLFSVANMSSLGSNGTVALCASGGRQEVQVWVWWILMWYRKYWGEIWKVLNDLLRNSLSCLPIERIKKYIYCGCGGLFGIVSSKISVPWLKWWLFG